MWAKSIIMGMVVLLFFSTQLLVADEHGETKGSMKEHKGSMMEEKGSMMEHKGSMKEHKGSMMEHEEGAINVGNKVCPVSGESVEVMGGPVKVEYKGKIYNLCCKMCAKDFKKNPEKYIKIVEEEIASRQKKSALEHNDNGEKDEHGDHDH